MVSAKVQIFTKELLFDNSHTMESKRLVFCVLIELLLWNWMLSHLLT